ncbi:MAG: HD domain-containing protein [bacterium]
MTDQEIIEKTVEFVKSELRNAEGGHDWFHIERVWKNARTIAKTEPVDLFVIELGALLHDIADYKFNDEPDGIRKVRRFLENLLADETVIDHVEKIMSNISFKGGNFTQDFFSPELAVVQDADRLDAIGAIGIARAFNYGGFKGRAMYDPSIMPVTGMTVEQYKNSNAPTINHFYEKLLLLKDRMNTETGRKMAQHRHQFMEQFLEQFFRECDGE